MQASDTEVFFVFAHKKNKRILIINSRFVPASYQMCIIPFCIIFAGRQITKEKDI